MAEKSLNYNPNTALIQGAADIGASMLPADMSGLQKVTQAGMMILASATKERQEVNKKLNNAAEASLSKAGGLSETDYNYAVDLTQKYKKEYLRGLKIGGAEGEKIKRQAMNNMVQLGNRSAEHKELNVTVSDNITKGKLSKNVSDEDRIVLANMVSGDYKITEDKNTGEKIYNISGLPSEDDKKLKDIYKLQKETGKTDLDYDKWLKETYPDYKGGTRQLTHQEYIDLSNRLKDNTFENTYYDLKEETKKDKNYYANENNVKDIRGRIMQAVPKTEQKFVDFLADDIQGQSFIELLNKDNSLIDELKESIEKLGGDLNGDGITKEEVIDAITNKDNPVFDLNNSLDIFAGRMTNAAIKEHKSYWAQIDQQRQDDIDSRTPKSTERDTYFMGAVGGYVPKANIDSDVAILNEDPRDIPVRISYNNVKFRKQAGQYQIYTTKDKKGNDIPGKFVNVTKDKLLATLGFDEKQGVTRSANVPVYDKDDDNKSNNEGDFTGISFNFNKSDESKEDTEYFPGTKMPIQKQTEK
tara:strand:+ start:129 stop:1712 length:1584 start_codon:yes stop_codon:yes gene_type:complete